MAFDKKKYKSLKERIENSVLFFVYNNGVAVFEDDVKVVHELTGLPFDMLDDGTFYLFIGRDKADEILNKVSDAGYRVGICDPIQY